MDGETWPICLFPKCVRHPSRSAGSLLEMLSDVHESTNDTADCCQPLFPYVANLMTAVSASSYSTFDLSLLLFLIMTIHFAGGHMGAN